MAERTSDPHLQEPDHPRLLDLGGSAGDVSAAEHREGRMILVDRLTRRPGSRPRGRRFVLAVAAALALFATALAVTALLLRREGVSWTGEGTVAVERDYATVPPNAAGRLVFSDGSAIDLDGATAVRLGARGSADIVLERGRARMHVGARTVLAWKIHIGSLEVAPAAGSKTELSWSDASHAEILVQHGEALVRTPAAPEVLSLRAKQRLRASVSNGELQLENVSSVDDVPKDGDSTQPALGDVEAPPTEDPSRGAATAANVDPATAPEPRRAKRGAWSDRVRVGDFDGVVREAEARGVEEVLRQAPSSELMALADAARYTNRHALSRSALLAQRSRFPSSIESRTAAFLLARIADDVERDPRAALPWYERYMLEAPDGPYAAEAHGRRMIAVAHVDGRDAARPLAAAYLKRYPRGMHASVARDFSGR